jgi:hypothetical protein
MTAGDHTSDRLTDDTTSRRGLIVGLVLGVPVIAYGVRGVFVDATDTHPAELARWIVGAAVVNDLILLPLAGAAAWVLRRFTPTSAWPVVRAGALTVGVLALVAWPFVRGYGDDPGNPSRLPRDYGLGLAVAVAIVAALTTALAAWRVRRARGAPGPTANDASGVLGDEAAVDGDDGTVDVRGRRQHE